MNKCPACLSEKIYYAFKKFENRYLQCSNCGLVYSNEKIYSDSCTIKYHGIKYEVLSINDLIFHFNKIKQNDSIEIIQIFNVENISNINKAFNFILTKKTIYIILNKYNFNSVEILKTSSINYNIIAKKNKVQRPKISFIIPVYNEINTCLKTINNLKLMTFFGADKEIIIVESNSTDGTRDLLIREYSNEDHIKIILQPSPEGKGNAVREGIKNSCGDYIAIQDADDEYDLDDYYNLVPYLLSGEETFVMGSRHSGSWWKMRKFQDQPIRAFLLNFGQLFFTYLINKVGRTKLKDPFTMFKIFRSDILKNIELVSNRFDLDHEIVIKLIRSGHIPLEVPVNYKSRSFSEGKKIRLIADPLSWLKAIYIFGVLGK
jgi:hypothetical protein